VITKKRDHLFLQLVEACTSDGW